MSSPTQNQEYLALNSIPEEERTEIIQKYIKTRRMEYGIAMHLIKNYKYNKKGISNKLILYCPWNLCDKPATRLIEFEGRMNVMHKPVYYCHKHYTRQMVKYAQLRRTINKSKETKSLLF
uniref:Uncharacterized protein n=1 Tax=Iridovirus LCIVAC01 TaxID=2506607 RepID=A0A481YQF3_9VIRU|nr:MAG: hypothetical protein LCIVAC01_00090 [Iridovirus LCIVAC01]